MLPLPCQWASCAVTQNTAPLVNSEALGASKSLDASPVPFIVVVSSFVSVYTIMDGFFHHVLDILEEIQVSPRFDQRPTIAVMGSLVAVSSLSTVNVYDMDLIATGTRRQGNENGTNDDPNANDDDHCTETHSLRLNLNAASFGVGPRGCTKILTVDYENEWISGSSGESSGSSGSSRASRVNASESTTIRHIQYYQTSSYVGMIVTTPRHGYMYHIHRNKAMEAQSSPTDIEHLCTITFTSEVLQMNVMKGYKLPILYVLSVGGIEMWSLPVPGSQRGGGGNAGAGEKGGEGRNKNNGVVPSVLYTVQPLHGISATLRRIPRGLVTLSHNSTLWIVPNAPGEKIFSPRRGSFVGGGRGNGGHGGSALKRVFSSVPSVSNRSHSQQPRHRSAQRGIVQCLSHLNGAVTRNEEEVEASICCGGSQYGPPLISVSNNPHNMMIEQAEFELRSVQQKRQVRGNEMGEEVKEVQEVQEVKEEGGNGGGGGRNKKNARRKSWSSLMPEDYNDTTSGGSGGSGGSGNNGGSETDRKEDQDDPFNTLVVVHLESVNDMLKKLHTLNNVSTTTSSSSSNSSNNSNKRKQQEQQNMDFLESIMSCTQASKDVRPSRRIDLALLSRSFVRSNCASQLGKKSLRATSAATHGDERRRTVTYNELLLTVYMCFFSIRVVAVATRHEPGVASTICWRYHCYESNVSTRSISFGKFFSYVLP